MPSTSFINALIHEKSPYLIQHARNPVNWYPWSNEAFQKAKSENIPVFLSIGYSTCHWCHVMEKESFEDTDVANLMNDTFICVKVDREERPDIDSIYMKASQMISGATGWPLTIIMTPDKKPFFTATYIPKTSRFGRIGMLDLIPRIKKQWRDHPSQIIEYSNQITQVLAKPKQFNNSMIFEKKILDQTISNLSKTYDTQYGGFGDAPKFPSSHILSFLLQSYYYTKQPELINMVESTLQKMRFGGMYDQIGFGFHRYSTDRKWLLPHFEKMLYDQAMLSYTYLETFQITGNPFYCQVSEEIFTYVLRDLTSSEGAFYSAEDADSDGEEGKFYLWSINQIKEVLTDQEFNILSGIYPVDNQGNFYEESSGKSMGTNILYLTANLSESQKKLITPINKKLFQSRRLRKPPFKDTKILTDWNALMITSFAKAASVLHSKTYQDVAMKAMDFICHTMFTDKYQIMHRYKDGDIAIKGKLDDYAFMIQALLALYENTFDTNYLETALGCADFALNHFWDNDHHGFFFTSNNDEQLIVRPKEAYDGAIPSGNAVFARNLIKLAKITGQMVYENKAEELIKAFSDLIHRIPQAFTQMMMAFQFAQNDSCEIVICGRREDSHIKEIIRKLQSMYSPDKTVILKDAFFAEQLSELAPYTKDYQMIDDKVSVYVCKGHACERPLTGKDHIANRLFN
jgi:hypothetical protein